MTGARGVGRRHGGAAPSPARAGNVSVHGLSASTSDADNVDRTMGGPARIEDLRAEARYRRERLELYRAKVYGPRPTSMARLRELERESAGAQARLHRAEQQQS